MHNLYRKVHSCLENLKDFPLIYRFFVNLNIIIIIISYDDAIALSYVVQLKKSALWEFYDFRLFVVLSKSWHFIQNTKLFLRFFETPGI